MSEHSPDMPLSVQGKVPLCTKLAWGMGGAADFIYYNGLNSLVLPIFNVGLGVDAVKLGYAVGLPRILDALVDPFIGNFSDNLRTRWGRRRPVILAGAVFASFFAGLLFSPPRSFDASQLLGWFMTVSCLFYVAYAFFMIPYSALGLEITDDYNERTCLLAWRPYCGIAAGLCVPWLYKLCLSVGSTEAEGARIVGWLVGLITLLLALIPVVFVKERAHPTTASFGFLHSLRLTYRNKAFLSVSGSTLSILLGWFLATPLGLYLIIYHLYGGNKSQAAVFSGISGMVLIGAGFLGLPLGAWLSARMGKAPAMRTMLVTCILSIGSSWWLFTPANPWLSLLPVFAAGLLVNGCFLITSSLLGDICDADELETGLRREGIYSASLEFTKKFAVGISTLLTGYVLSFTGIDPALPAQSASTLVTLRIMYMLALATPMIAAFLCISLYPINRERALAISQALKVRRQGGV